MRQFKKQSQLGFTLVELLATVLISTTALSGMIYVYSEINNHFTHEFIRSDVKSYCDRVLDDMTYNIRASRRITYSMFGNHQKVIVELGRNDRVTYTISENEGVLKNGRPIDYFRTRDERGLKICRISDFSCKTPTDWPSYSDSKVKNATYNVKFTVDLIDKFQNGKVLERITSEREIFAPSIFVKQRT